MPITAKTALYGVIGHPISHSLSPVIHNQWFEKYQIDAAYLAFTAPVDGFADTAHGLFNAGLKGLNVTAPFKADAFDFADHKTEAALRAGAVNTLYLNEKEGIIGHNTDGAGFFKSIEKVIPSGSEKNIALIGAGGAACGLVAEFLTISAGKVFLYNRTRHNAEALKALFTPAEQARIAIYDDMQTLPLQATDCLINTVNAPDLLNRLSPDIFARLPKTAPICDITYGKETDFAAATHTEGYAYSDGLPMLFWQAAFAFEKFTDVFPEVVIERLK